MRRALLALRHILMLHMTEDKKFSNIGPLQRAGGRGALGKTHQIILALARDHEVESKQRDKRESNCLGKSLPDTVKASLE